MILRWWDRDGIQHETPVDHVEVRPDGTVEGYRNRPAATEQPHLSEVRSFGVQQLEPGDVQGRILVVA